MPDRSIGVLTAHDDRWSNRSHLGPFPQAERGVRAADWAGHRNLEVSMRYGVAIVALDGVLDDALAASLIPALTATATACDGIVLELDRVTLGARSAMVTVCTAIGEGPREPSCCIVTARHSGRATLSRWGLPTSFAVFNSVGDALQARLFAENGYGPGWRPAA